MRILFCMLIILISSKQISAQTTDSTSVITPAADSSVTSTEQTIPDSISITTDTVAVTVTDTAADALTDSTAIIATGIDTTLKTVNQSADTSANAVQDTTGKKTSVAETRPAPPPNVLSAFFNTSEIVLQNKEHFVSNTLRIVNNQPKEAKFSVELAFPQSWKIIGTPDRNYTLATGDSLMIPVRFIPSAVTGGNIATQIQALVLDENQLLLADANFQIRRKRVVKWTLSSDEGSRVYFPVGDTTVPFTLNINNESTEPIDIIVQKKQLGTRISIADTITTTSAKRPREFMLEAEEDTSFVFNASLKEQDWGHRRIDLDNYQPATDDDELRNTVFFRSYLAGEKDQRFTGNQRMDVVRLSSDKTVNPYGSGVLPLTVDANFFNILGVQPVMNLDLRGSTILCDGALLNYQAQTNFYTYRYNNSSLNDVFYRLGYSNRRTEIQLGNISGGYNLLPVSGRGISGSYLVTDHIRTGAYYVQNNYRSDEDHTKAYGAFARYQKNNWGTALLQVGRSTNEAAQRDMNYAAGSVGIRLIKNHQMGFGYAVSNTNDRLNNRTYTGSSISANYSGVYLDKKLTTNLRGTFYSSGYSYNGLPGYHADHRSVYRRNNNLGFGMQNSLSRYSQYIFSYGNTDRIDNSIFYNQLFVNIRMRNSGLTPSIIYNRSRLNNIELRFAGAGIDYHNGQAYTRLGIYARGGYNFLPDYDYVKPFFTFQFGMAVQHNTSSFTGRYYYGPQFISSLAAVTSYTKYPQSVFLSYQKQMRLPDPHFIAQFGASYSYFNQYSRHNLGIYPEIYYYTTNHWRFKLAAGYNLVVSKVYTSGTDYAPDPSMTSGPGKNAAQSSFFLNAGIRKDFGIPLPKKLRCSTMGTVTFTAFLDANGNKLFDKNESELSNIIIRVNTDEIITNAEGKATLRNYPGGTYQFMARSVYAMQEWYPLFDDSITIGLKDEVLIPFVKGVKVNGKIVIQKDRFSTLQNDIDLSRLRVEAIDVDGVVHPCLTDKNGVYTIYLPPGTYQLRMDEGLLGNSLGLVKNNVTVVLENSDSYNYNFYIVEKKRKLNIKKFGTETETEAPSQK